MRLSEPQAAYARWQPGTAGELRVCDSPEERTFGVHRLPDRAADTLRPDRLIASACGPFPTARIAAPPDPYCLAVEPLGSVVVRSAVAPETATELSPTMATLVLAEQLSPALEGGTSMAETCIVPSGGGLPPTALQAVVRP